MSSCAHKYSPCTYTYTCVKQIGVVSPCPRHRTSFIARAAPIRYTHGSQVISYAEGVLRSLLSSSRDGGESESRAESYRKTMSVYLCVFVIYVGLSHTSGIILREQKESSGNRLSSKSCKSYANFTTHFDGLTSENIEEKTPV